jgi:hypothetical protein
VSPTAAVTLVGLKTSWHIYVEERSTTMQRMTYCTTITDSDRYIDGRNNNGGGEGDNGSKKTHFKI